MKSRELDFNARDPVSLRATADAMLETVVDHPILAFDAEGAHIVASVFRDLADMIEARRGPMQ